MPARELKLYCVHSMDFHATVVKALIRAVSPKKAVELFVGCDDFKKLDVLTYQFVEVKELLEPAGAGLLVYGKAWTCRLACRKGRKPVLDPPVPDDRRNVG
jgi:hypothetical protein